MQAILSDSLNVNINHVNLKWSAGLFRLRPNDSNHVNWLGQILDNLSQCKDIDEAFMHRHC